MAEVVVPVLTVGVRMRCDRCNIGEMVCAPDLNQLFDDGTVQHQCNKCGWLNYYDKIYPTTRTTISPLPNS